ncbi:hypothetical protein TRFO_38378 [Tritrichomonas foetus]|uniref:Uncharacterized protein n=1 Tax=Tritrichomonas foetus TaxID=1144522 RepID=A0A1J4JCW4_9EUKA|nr:hypothetical protein TRFO_38378 [Tritrichomonas foetus]|eukprot:OHS95507.1 hypothetical protein TRFO_38378 [Tritrichomonas foetus]
MRSFLTASGGLQLPDLGFMSSRSAGGQSAQQKIELKETSFFAKCKIQLKSPNKKIGTKRDKKGSVSITTGPSNLRYNIEKLTINMKPTDDSLKIERKGDNSCVLSESSKTHITTWFNEPIEMLSYIATIFLHRRQNEDEKYLDGIVGTGHIINDDDDYDIELTTWKIKSKYSLGDLLEISKPYSAEDAPKMIYMSGVGLGGVRIFFGKKKYIAAVVKEVREYRRRVRTQVIYPKLQQIENLTQQLLAVHEAAVKRQRIVQTTKQMKKKLLDLTAAVDANSILIEQMYKEQKDFDVKMAEIERAKRRIDVDDNEKQLEFMKEQQFLTTALNEAIQKQDQMEFDMIKWQGESAMFGKCIQAAFAVLCVGMTETSEGETLVERLESARRQIAEAVFL